MTSALPGEEAARRIDQALPGAVVRYSESDVWVTPDSLLETARFLKETLDLDFAYLSAVTAVDYVEYFEIVYHLLSLSHNQRVVLKTECFGRDEPTVPSLVSLWQGANIQEREVWDLMGVRFDGHPNMKRILLWEGFPGHPLRKDYLGQ